MLQAANLTSKVLLPERRLLQPKLWQSVLNFIHRREVGILTGLPALDRQLLGLQGMAVFQGETKVHKSTLAWQVALRSAHRGIPAYVLDRENGAVVVGQRVLCTYGQVGIDLLPKLPAQELESLHERVQSLPLFVTHEMLTFEHLKEEVEEVLEHYPKQQMLLVVDSLQSVVGMVENRRSAIDAWLVQLDELQLKYQPRLTILVISEKNRGAYGEASISGGKESGTIEYKCSSLFNLSLGEGGLVNMKCLANRHGSKDIFTRLKPVFNKGGFTFTLKEAGLDL